MSTTYIVPSKGRPENVRRLITAMEDTAGNELGTVVVAVDPTEPQYEAYEEVVNAHRWPTLMRVNTTPQRVGPIINRVAQEIEKGYDYIGFMGDDHLPRTKNWDELLVDALDQKPGVAYGNDLIQGANLPTAAVITSRVVQVLGYMVPRMLEHLYLDDYWKLLGTGLGNLQYCPDVIIEHLHPTVGKSAYDATYHAANSERQFTVDGTNFRRYQEFYWTSELNKLKKELNLV